MEYFLITYAWKNIDGKYLLASEVIEGNPADWFLSLNEPYFILNVLPITIEQYSELKDLVG